MRYRRGILLLVIILISAITSVSGQSEDDSQPDQSIIAGDITIRGNKTTSGSVIMRELLFKTGDTIRIDELSRLIAISCENILKTSLFHTATIDSYDNGKTTDFIINVTERWYWWVWPMIENPDRNFNDWWQHHDITRLSAGLHFQHENVRGRMEKLNVKAMGGYRTFLEGNYEWPYINKSKSLGLGIYASYTSQHELDYTTIDNKQVFYHGKGIMFRSTVIAANLKYRPGTHFSHFLTFQYWQPWFSDSIPLLNPEYLLTVSDQKLLGLSYLLKADYRDNRYYPLRGFHAETEGTYLVSVAENYNQRSLRSSFRGYLPVAGNFYAASEFTFRLTAPELKPYYLQNALGYDREFVRGYEYLVIHAPHYWILKSHLKYAALPLAIFRVPFIKSEKFNTIPLSIYAGPHFDLGKAFPTLDPVINPLEGQLLTGYGIGVDFVTYYDKVLRCEYTFRKDGPSGFFLHFMAMI